MARKSAHAAEVPEEEVAEEVAPKPTGDEATVTWRGKSRTFSRKVHGDKFFEYAEEFAAKFIKGTLV